MAKKNQAPTRRLLKVSSREDSRSLGLFVDGGLVSSETADLWADEVCLSDTAPVDEKDD